MNGNPKCWKAGYKVSRRVEIPTSVFSCADVVIAKVNVSMSNLNASVAKDNDEAAFASEQRPCNRVGGGRPL
jgi:hypothetical protein